MAAAADAAQEVETHGPAWHGGRGRLRSGRLAACENELGLLQLAQREATSREQVAVRQQLAALQNEIALLDLVLPKVALRKQVQVFL